ncbi:MAG: YihY/virulence factor BrkB family protein, partial [Alphaproteobacteria bacterium]|nr:YihY/virulence factor BrkB family protein [Alphaproteobacteria bacterium]
MRDDGPGTGEATRASENGGARGSIFAAPYWDRDTRAMGGFRAAYFRTGRVVFAIGRDVLDGQLSLWAMSLVYTTLLSLVPLLAISFSVLKGFGVHNRIEPVLATVLEPFGEKGVEITARILEFVENVKVGVLGSVGLALLIYTVVSLMQKIEHALNATWRVGRSRTFARRFSDYLSVIAIGPVLVFSALGLTASAAAVLPAEELARYGAFDEALALGRRIVPYLLVVAAFTFIYVFMPNTRVRTRAALIGAVVAGTLWQSAGWAFASFVATSTSYTAIYSAFATLILFMIWLYVGWLILLIGAAVAYYVQTPQSALIGPGPVILSARLREWLVLVVAARIAAVFRARQKAPTAADLATMIPVPPEAVDWAVAALAEARLITPTGDDPPSYLPAGDPAATPLATVLAAARAADERPSLD